MMKRKNYFILSAGILNLFTALLHTIGGQIELVLPLQKSDLTNQAKAEWFGVWHLVTIFLFATSFLLIKNYINGSKVETLKHVGFLFILLSIPFCISSVVHKLLVPQWILLLPIGVLIYFGTKKSSHA